MLTFTPACFSFMIFKVVWAVVQRSNKMCTPLFLLHLATSFPLNLCFLSNVTWSSPRGETSWWWWARILVWWVLFVRNTRVNMSSFSRETSLSVVGKKGLHVLLWRHSPVVVRHHTVCSDWMSSRISWMVLSPTADGNRIRTLHPNLKWVL